MADPEDPSELLTRMRSQEAQAFPVSNPDDPVTPEHKALTSFPGTTVEQPKYKDLNPPPTFEAWKTGYEDAAPQSQPKATISAIPRDESGARVMHISPPMVSRKVLYKDKSEEELRKIYDAWIKHEWPKQVEKYYKDQAEVPDESKLMS